MKNTIISHKILDELNFGEVYPHGERYLFDEQYKNKEGNYCIMAIYPTDNPTEWFIQFNSERTLWSNDPHYYNSGHIKINSVEQLNTYLELSKLLK